MKRDSVYFKTWQWKYYWLQNATRYVISTTKSGPKSRVDGVSRERPRPSDIHHHPNLKLEVNWNWIPPTPFGVILYDGIPFWKGYWWDWKLTGWMSYSSWPVHSGSPNPHMLFPHLLLHFLLCFCSRHSFCPECFIFSRMKKGWGKQCHARVFIFSGIQKDENRGMGMSR